MEKTSHAPSLTLICVVEATSWGPDAVCIKGPMTAEKNHHRVFKNYDTVLFKLLIFTHLQQPRAMVQDALSQ